MAKQHVDVLHSLGMPQDQIDALENMKPEELEQFKPDSYIQSVRDAQKTTLLNDNEFLGSIPDEKIPEATKKKIESGQYARFQNEILETAKKNLGLEETDLADMTEDERKSIKKMVTKIAEKHLGKKGNVQGLQDMQKQVQELTVKLEKKDTDWQEKLDGELNKVNGSSQNKLVKVLTKAELSSIEDVTLNVPASYVIEPVLAKLTEKYAVVIGDNEELLLKQKANPQLDVMENGKILTFSQAVKNVVVAEKLGTAKSEKVKEEEERKKRTILIKGERVEDQILLPSYIEDKIKNNIIPE